MARLEALVRYAHRGTGGSVFISGPTGIGKTVLMSSALASCGEDTLRLHGKFDQLGGDRPFSGVAEAIDSYLQRTRYWGSIARAKFAKRLRQRLGHHAGVMTCALENLSALIGSTPLFQPLSPESLLSVVSEGFIALLQELQSEASALVLVLDDIHWADEPSIRLIRSLLGAPELRNTAMIALHRTADPNIDNPALESLLRDLDDNPNDYPTSFIKLTPLDRNHTIELTAEVLDVPQTTAIELGSLVNRLTGGTPYFVVEFVCNALEDNLIQADENHVTFNGEAIASSDIGNVDQTTKSRILRLPIETQDKLAQAALIGSTFVIDLLAAMNGVSVESIAAILAPAVRSGLVEPVRSEKLGNGLSYIRFVHDHVQEAASLGLDTENINRIHSAIATAQITIPELEASVLETAQHYAMGLPPSGNSKNRNFSPDAPLYISALYRAAIASRGVGAYTSGLRYATLAHNAATDLHRSDNDRHSVSNPEPLPSLVALTLELAEQQFCSGQVSESIQTLSDLPEDDLNLLEKGKVSVLQMVALSANGLFPDAFALGCSTLSLLGYELPSNPSDENYRLMLKELLDEMSGRDPLDLVDLNENNDPVALIAAEVLMRLGTPAFAGVPTMFPFVCMTAVLVAIRNGNSPWAASCYVMLGIWLGHERDTDNNMAFEFGQLGCELSDRYGDPSSRAICKALHGGLVAHWKLPTSECIEISMQSYQIAITSGEVLWSSYALQLGTYSLTFSGISLDDLYDIFDEYTQLVTAVNNAGSQAMLASQQLSLLALRGDDLMHEPESFAEYSESDLRALPSRAFIYCLLCHRLLIRVIQERYTEGLTLIDEINECAQFCRGTSWLAETAMLEGIAHLRLNGETTGYIKEQLHYLQDLANGCQQTYLPMAALLEAEIKLHSLSTSNTTHTEIENTITSTIEPVLEIASRYNNLKTHALARQAQLCAMKRHALKHTTIVEFSKCVADAFGRWGAPAAARYIAPDYQANSAITGSAIALQASTVRESPVKLDEPNDSMVTEVQTISIENFPVERQAPSNKLTNQADSRLIRALDEVDNAVLLVTDDLVIEFANSFAGEISHLPSQKLVGNKLNVAFELYEPGRPEPLTGSEILARHGDNIKNSERRLDLRHPHLSRRVQCWTVPITTGDSLQGETIVCLRDTTPLDRLHREIVQHSTTLSLGRIVGGIAHDFNNILMTIHGSAELIEFDRQGMNPRLKNALNMMQGAIDQAAKLTRQLLKVGQQDEVENADVDLTNVIEEVVSLLKLSVSDIEIKFTNQAHATAIHGSRISIHNALLNLCINAVEAMPEGGTLSVDISVAEVDVSVAHSWGTTAGRHAVIEVCDTGSGIDPNIMAHIFDPYFTTGKQFRGTGLGLATVKATIDKLGGFIDVFSDVGLGATFRVFLPLLDVAVTEPEKPKQSLPIVPVQQDLNGVVILIVDDELPVASVICSLLELVGAHVYSAQSVAQARILFNEHHHQIDVVLVDLIMPDGGAEALLPYLVETDPNVKAIVCSGVAEPHESACSFPAIRAALTKPIKIKDLSRTIQQVIYSDVTS